MKKISRWMQQREHNLRMLLVIAYFGMWIVAALFPGVGDIPGESADVRDGGYQVISVAIYTGDTAAATDEKTIKKAEKQQKMEKRKAIRESLKAFLQDFVAGDEKKEGLGLVFLASVILGGLWFLLCLVIGYSIEVAGALILFLAGLVGITFITTPWVRKRLPEGNKKNARLIAVMLLLGGLLLFPGLLIIFAG
jgi:hypothetical protein